jgi:Rhodopirellula transposase DDE domain
MVAELLHELGYHFQANRKVREDRDYADWDALLGYVNRTAHAYFAAGDPGLAITVCHRPPCTSKWNKIEYQFIVFVPQNWGEVPDQR